MMTTMSKSLRAENERLQADISMAVRANVEGEAEIERLAAENCKLNDLLMGCHAKIEQLRAALSDVLPLAERYIGRSDGVSDVIHDKIANARRAAS